MLIVFKFIMIPEIVLCVCLAHTPWGLKHNYKNIDVKHSAKFFSLKDAKNNMMKVGSIRLPSLKRLQKLIPGSSVGSPENGSLMNTVPKHFMGSSESIKKLVPKGSMSSSISGSLKHLVPEGSMGSLLDGRQKKSVPEKLTEFSISGSQKKSVTEGSKGSSKSKSLKFIPKEFEGSLLGERVENLVPEYSKGSSVNKNQKKSAQEGSKGSSLMKIQKKFVPDESTSFSSSLMKPEGFLSSSLTSSLQKLAPGGSFNSSLQEFGSSLREGLGKLVKGAEYNFETMAKDAVADIFKAAGGTLQTGWDAVKRLEVPVKELFMYFPNNVVAIVDKATKSIWYITSEVGKYIKAESAYGIYEVLKVISTGVGPAMKELNMDCIAVQPVHKDLHYWSFNRIEVAAYKLCGLSKIETINNATIANLKNDLKRATVSFVIPDLHAKIPSVNVTNMLVTLLYDAPFIVHINRTIVEGNFTINTSDSDMLRRVQLRISRFGDLTVKIDEDTLQQMKRSIGTIANIGFVKEALSNLIGEEIKREVSAELKGVETRLAAYFTKII